MGMLLTALATAPRRPRRPDDASLRREQAVMLGEGNGMEHLTAVAQPSPFACPDCHGGLWEITDSDPVRFRCQVGHGFTIRSLQHALWSTTDDAVWTALRALQEKSEMIRRMASVDRAGGAEQRAAALEQVARQIDEQCDGLRALVEESPMPIE
jgi:two-component system chemotaxis response regulator CheB